MQVLAARGKILWDGNASRGKSIWKVINKEGECVINVFEDEEEGSVWRFKKSKGAHRCEGHGAKGFEAKEGDDIYIGWKLKLHQPHTLTTNANFQWKAYGSNMLQNYPIVIKTIVGQLHLEQYDPSDDGDVATSHKKNALWHTKLETDKWHSIVLHLHVSRNIRKGFVEFWYNGQQQNLHGHRRFTCRTLDAEHCDPKWGVYGGDSGAVTTYVTDLKIASTYKEAAPK